MKSETICIYLRPRPMSPPGSRLGIDFDENIVRIAQKIEYNQIVDPAHRRNDLQFRFDHVFQPQCTQEEVFLRTIKPSVDEVLRGLNATVFAYGQTVRLLVCADIIR